MSLHPEISTRQAAEKAIETLTARTQQQDAIQPCFTLVLKDGNVLEIFADGVIKGEGVHIMMNHMLPLVDCLKETLELLEESGNLEDSLYIPWHLFRKGSPESEG